MIALIISAALAFGLVLTIVGWLPLMIERIVRRSVELFLRCH